MILIIFPAFKALNLIYYLSLLVFQTILNFWKKTGKIFIPTAEYIRYESISNIKKHPLFL